MRRVIVFTVCATYICLPVVLKAATLGKLDELERRFDDYDRRLTGVERKITILLHYVRKGQGPMIDMQRDVQRQLRSGAAAIDNFPRATMTARLRVMEDGTNVYLRPSAGSAIIARLNAGTWLDIHGRTELGGWYHVTLPGGQSGYVYERFLESMR